MESELVNRCQRNEKTLKESYRLALQPRILFFLLSSLLFAALGVWSGVKTRFERPVIPLTAFAMTILYWIVGLTTVRRFTSVALRRMEETLHRRSFDITVSFCGEELLSQSELSSLPIRIRYDALKRIPEGKDVIVLYTRAKQFVTLDRAGFGPGTEADFWKLMNEKCPKAVPQKRRTGEPA